MPMSGRFTKVIAAVMSAMLLASCSDWPSGLKPAETYETPETTAVVTEAPATPTPIPTPTEKPVPKFPEFEPDYKSAAPALGYKTRSLTFFRDGNPITGRITYPEGEGPFKTIIISNGLYAGFGRYAAFAQRFSTYGYAVIEYQYQNGTAPSPYHDPDWLGDFIYEQVLDLYAVLDGATLRPAVAPGNICLCGHSRGGLVIYYGGTMRQTEIKGLLLLDPSYYACRIMKFEKEKTIRTDIYPLISRCYIPVVIISGTKAFACDPAKQFDQARASLPYSEYYVIEGATHTFKGEYGDQAVDIAVECMTKWDEEGR